MVAYSSRQYSFECVKESSRFSNENENLIRGNICCRFASRTAEMALSFDCVCMRFRDIRGSQIFVFINLIVILCTQRGSSSSPPNHFFFVFFHSSHRETPDKMLCRRNGAACFMWRSTFIRCKWRALEQPNPEYFSTCEPPTHKYLYGCGKYTGLVGLKGTCSRRTGRGSRKETKEKLTLDGFA